MAEQHEPLVEVSGRRCFQCKYSLQGLPEERLRCPECGTSNPVFRAYTFRRRVFSWGFHYAILDAERAEQYVVRNERLSLLRRQFVLRDAQRDPVATVREQPLSFALTYHIFRPDQPTMAIRQRALSVRTQFTVFEIDTPDQRLVTSSTATGHKVRAGEEVIALVDRRPWAMWDVFRARIDSETDQVLLLAAAIVLETQR